MSMGPAKAIDTLARIRAGVPSDSEEAEALNFATRCISATPDWRLCTCGHYVYNHMNRDGGLAHCKVEGCPCGGPPVLA